MSGLHCTRRLVDYMGVFPAFPIYEGPQEDFMGFQESPPEGNSTIIPGNMVNVCVKRIFCGYS